MCDIVLLVYDQLDYTRNCIESILRNTSCEYRLLVIDNGSVKKETVEYLRQISAANSTRMAVHRIGKNIGYVGAVNFGLKITSAPYVCVISNDTIAYPGWLEEMIRTAQQDRRIGLVNPLWAVPKRFVGGRDRYIATTVRRSAGRYIETDWARGFCFLACRTVIDKIGGLDEAYAPGYFDDWDYSVRAIRAGFKCARALGAFVWHYKNVTYGLEFSTESMRTKGRIFYGRYGVPLRVLLIHDSPDASMVPEYSRLVRSMLDAQDRLTILAGRGFPGQTPHTNLRIRFVRNRFFLKMYALWYLWDNLRYAKTRRYDIILTSSSNASFIRSIRHLGCAYEGRLCETDNLSVDKLMERIVSLKHRKAKQYTDN